MNTKQVTCEKTHVYFDRSIPPAAVVEPGELVLIETLDACFGKVRDLKGLLAYRSVQKAPVNPLSGPVYVRGAEPGMTLVAEIVGIDLDDTGFQIIGPSRGIVRDEIKDTTVYPVSVKDGMVLLPNGIQVRADPVVGTFGNAPAGEPTNLPNRLGGNCDIPFVKRGCKIYIPVEVPGGIFFLGDLHACQGDGEVVGAPEIGGRTLVRFTLQAGRPEKWFMIEDDSRWHSACSAETESEAARIAVFQNAGFISRTYGITLKDALILLTLCGRITVSRTGMWGPADPVVCASFSKEDVHRALLNCVRT